MPEKIFRKTKECLLIILEAVGFFRRQMFFEGSQRISDLINNVSMVSDYIIQCEMSDEDKQEWIFILQAFLNAQESKDYIHMADILEEDMLTFLQKLQGRLMAAGYTELDEYWEANMKMLKQVNSSLYQVILRDSEEVTKQSLGVQYEPFLAVNGLPTLKAHWNEKTFDLHSTLNPEWESKQLAEYWLEESAPEYLIFGMGMGYHIKALLQADEEIKVIVLENHIEPLVMALTYQDWEEEIAEDRLEIIYETDLLKLLQYVNQKKETTMFYIHYPSLQCVEQSELKVILEDYFITTSSMLEQRKTLDTNFVYLQKQNFPSCDEVKDIFAHKDVVIVAGGPSVDDEIDSLKKYRDKLIVLSVGTIARKLIAKGIRPDAIIITDPHKDMHAQVEDLDAEDIPLLLLSTASRSVEKYYSGPIYLVYQQGYQPAEKVAGECGYSLFQTGGSVTTTALDVSIRFGAEKIILVGADMGYTDNRSHASGIGRDESDFSSFRQVPAVGGGCVYSPRNLDIYRKWIERRISGLETPVVYNTSRGARIAGTVEAKLKDIM